MLEDVRLMEEALKEAKIAYSLQEIPVGVIVVYNKRIITRAHNRKEELQDPTAHAEILALQKAARYLGTWHLENATLYVTLEPCPMCAYAMVLARIKRLVFGASDPKTGAAGSVVNIIQNKKFNHQIEVTKNILNKECSLILKNFFLEKRQFNCRKNNFYSKP
ncbi:MAG: tRNA adenosine(34) deaminase TadA [Candidatus Atribacteria bacterium]|nr:tRNA adenosine(34) deaminase TadA [Candidatus Atribacteria bacterium]